MLDYRYFLRHYLLSRRRVFYLLGLFFASFMLFGALFDQSRAVLSYLLSLLGFITLLVGIWDMGLAFQAYRKELLYDEPHPETPLEAVLVDKLQDKEAQRQQELTDNQSRFNDLLDYYTLWVHQVKTPIAAAQLFVQEVEGPLKQQLEQEVFKIDQYANLVLQYLRLESFHDDLVLSRESLDDMVKEVVRKYALFFIQKGLSLDLHDLDKSVLTDRKWLLVIIEQVLSNSLKYTQSGGIEIYADDQALYLKDTGLGIKNSDVLRVFERGFSGYNGRLTQQSSGLGLYLSKTIADQLGHQISIKSEVGQGTTVRIGFEEKKLVVE